MNPAQDPASVGTLVLIALALIGGLAALSVIWRNLRPDPALHRQFITREEFDKHAALVRDELAQLRADGEDRVRRIHERLDRQTEQLIAVIKEHR